VLIVLFLDTLFDIPKYQGKHKQATSARIRRDTALGETRKIRVVPPKYYFAACVGEKQKNFYLLNLSSNQTIDATNKVLAQAHAPRV
jgi:hypothetical protein